MSSNGRRFLPPLRWSLATILLAPRGGEAVPPSEAERRDLFAWAARVGFTGIEISPRWYNIFDLDEPALLRLRLEIECEGLRVAGINVERAILAGPSAQRNSDRIRQAIHATAILGAGIVDVALAEAWEGAGCRPVVTGANYSKDDFHRAAAELKALARLADGNGIAISIELHDDGMLDDATRCRELIHAVGERNVGANPDVGNICRNPRRPGDWETALRELAPLTNCWHVKNYRAARPAPLESGDIDYRMAMEIMIGAGYQGWVGIESRTGGFRETQTAALEYLQALERSVG